MSHLHAHGSTHTSGAVDAIKLDDLAAPDDNTDLNATVSAHGLLKKLSNVSTEFMNGQGNWATPAAAAGVYWAKITNGTDVAITGATSATLNRMHVVSGTSADYTITISGLSPTTGDVLGFYVKDYAAASKQFKLDAGGTVKIAGRTRYLVLTHANVVLLMWDGTDWQPLVLCLDSPWTAVSTITIEGTTSNPSKGTTTTDRYIWRRVGACCEVRYEYRQTSTGSNGSGQYIFGIPFTVDTTNYATANSTVDNNNPSVSTIGSGRYTNFSTVISGAVSLYSSTRFRICGIGTNGSAVDATPAGSGTGLAATNVAFSADIMVPITDW